MFVWLHLNCDRKTSRACFWIAHKFCNSKGYRMLMKTTAYSPLLLLSSCAMCAHSYLGQLLSPRLNAVFAITARINNNGRDLSRWKTSGERRSERNLFYCCFVIYEKSESFVMSLASTELEIYCCRSENLLWGEVEGNQKNLFGSVP